MDKHFPAQEEIKAYINRQLSERYIRLQPHLLVKNVQKVFPNQRRSQVHATIKNMISDGHLAYTNELSTTFLMRNWHADLKVSQPSNHNPDQSHAKCSTQTIPIRLSDGFAFGCGNHPTTQLCLQGLNIVMQHSRKDRGGQPLTVLDIGTGSGILAIAAALRGADKVVGIDTDPQACREARVNGELNQVSEKISFEMGDVTVVKGLTFEVVVANLRVPTLKGMYGPIASATTQGGFGLFSGFRRRESITMEGLFSASGWEKIWECHNRGWMAMAVKRQT